MKFIKKIIDWVSYPFIAYSVLVDEERRQNLDGKYDKYWERKNKKLAKKQRLDK